MVLSERSECNVSTSQMMTSDDEITENDWDVWTAYSRNSSIDAWTMNPCESTKDKYFENRSVYGEDTVARIMAHTLPYDTRDYEDSSFVDDGTVHTVNTYCADVDMAEGKEKIQRIRNSCCFRLIQQIDDLPPLGKAAVLIAIGFAALSIFFLTAFVSLTTLNRIRSPVNVLNSFPLTPTPTVMVSSSPSWMDSKNAIPSVSWKSSEISLIPSKLPVTPLISKTPSMRPSNLETNEPSFSIPSSSVMEFSKNPSMIPDGVTNEPSFSIPSIYPTATINPSMIPSKSSIPSCRPSLSSNPTRKPSNLMSNSPSLFSLVPSFHPSTFPMEFPSLIPSNVASVLPSSIPSNDPTALTALPSTIPSNTPTIAASSIPSPFLTFVPSFQPSTVPTLLKTTFPSTWNTLQPTSFPSSSPTHSIITLPPSSITSIHPSNIPSGSPIPSNFTFAVMADIPYSLEEARLLAMQMQTIPDHVQFLVHVGDMNKASDTQCNEFAYSDVHWILRRNSPVPVFMLPGDNDWNDCPDVDLAWSHWTQYFLNFDEYWNYGWDVKRQQGRQENFSFLMNTSLVIGLNLVGGNVHDRTEWEDRLLDELEWTARRIRKHLNSIENVILLGHARPRPDHRVFFQNLAIFSDSLALPILYMHGDGHVWDMDSNMYNGLYMTSIQVDQGGLAPPVRVTVGEGPDYFTFER